MKSLEKFLLESSNNKEIETLIEWQIKSLRSFDKHDNPSSSDFNKIYSELQDLDWAEICDEWEFSNDEAHSLMDYLRDKKKVKNLFDNCVKNATSDISAKKIYDSIHRNDKASKLFYSLQELFSCGLKIKLDNKEYSFENFDKRSGALVFK